MESLSGGACETGPTVNLEAMTASATPAAVIGFWSDAGPRAWFRRRSDFDEAVRARFEATHLQASRGELEDWRGSGEGALALVLLLDQFPRHIYRGSAHAFATDPLARTAAGEALAAGFDLVTAASLQPFFYLPFEHHEDATSQARAIELFSRYADRTGDADYLRYAKLHAEVIARFGRFPHRNRVLGRSSTPEEVDYLANGGFRG
jgi:uncharacterized protein (DUF924 family)